MMQIPPDQNLIQLSITQKKILQWVHEELIKSQGHQPGIYQDLVKTIQRCPSTISSAIRKLEHKGIVHLEYSYGGLVRHVWLSEKGHNAFHIFSKTKPCSLIVNDDRCYRNIPPKKKPDGRSLRKKPRENLICPQCKREFHIIAGNPKNQKYCSLKCAYQDIKERTSNGSLSITCPNCEKKKSVPKRNVDRGRGAFCNKSCFLEYNKKLRETEKITRVCNICEKVFKVNLGAFAGSHVWKYCSLECRYKAQAIAARKKDGQRYKNPHGYIEVFCYDHPSHKEKKAKPITRRVMEHRLVMEEMLNRYLEPWEFVHHKNGIPDDNRPENLELWGKKHPIGLRVSDIYGKNSQRLALENIQLKLRISQLEQILSKYEEAAAKH